MTNGSIITNSGKKIFLNRAYKASPDYTPLSKFKVGTGNATPSVTNTDLTLPIPIQNTESVNACDSVSNWTAGTDTAIAIEATTKKEGNASLDWTKSGTTTATVTLTWDDASAAYDFSSERLHSWLYINDTSILATSGDVVKVRFGNDSSNYYERSLTKTEYEALQVAYWSDIAFNKSEADSTTGTPTDTDCDWFQIELTCPATSTVWTSGGVLVDDVRLAGSDDYDKTIVTDYPVINETEFEVETRCLLNAVEANGYDLNAIGLFNTDSTELMHSIDVYTAESKGNTDEFLYIIKDRVVD